MNSSEKSAAIGVFDSGVGGLTVARELIQLLPNENIVYFGDTARVPYGNKSPETIIRYSEQIIRFLLTQNVKAIVIACNTASAHALDTVSLKFDLPIIGVVKPGAHAAVASTKNKKVGVIGTVGTISSDVYTRQIHAIDPTIHVLGTACPLFVPLVEEEGWLQDPITTEVAKRYLTPLKETDIDTLILGCTHYPLIRSTLQSVMGEQVNLVNPAYETALEMQRLLKEKDLENPEGAPGNYRFFVSDKAKRFTSFANTILPDMIASTLQIEIEDY